ncbi:MAG: efflux RND transporter periplasmic adaptor subunit [Elusimicrobiota bacterium]|jgi:HlyD family secretion protein
MKNKKILLIVPILIAAGLLTWRILGRPFLYAGTVEATEVDISARVSSVISAFEAKEGRTVAAGQRLVTLAGEDLKLAADIADKDFERAAQLRKGGSIPQEAYDRARYKRDDAALHLAWCGIDSPIDGTVLAVFREAGELVGPGTKLLTLADLREVWAMVYVPQPLLARLALDQEVSGVLPESPGRRLTGRIAHINDQAEFTPKNVQTRQERTRLVFGVKIIFPNPDRMLKPGMTIEVKLPR